jgi:site-specific DNA recombinase
MTKDHLRAAIYARYSTDKQNERSIEDQVALCRTLAERAGYSVVRTYDDRAISGTSTVNRRGFLALMRDAKRGQFDIVVTEDVDRISRDQADFHAARKQLKFSGIEFHTAHGLVGEIVGSVRAMLSELYLSNLSQKTRRGLAGVVRDRRHAGGRAFGYRLVEGAAGQLAIDERETETVRRIFADYVAGRSPREIAAVLNREKVPGPRGGVWNASTIAGSRKRANGVLMNALYASRIVWNRQRFIKDPETGKRVSRLNPESEWMTADVPALRIVDPATFEAAQKIKAERGGERRYAAYPRHLLSGLLKCGCCGSGYIVVKRDKRGLALGCSRVRETGLCDNRRTVSMKAAEAKVWEGVERLAAPEVIAEHVNELYRYWREMKDSEANRRRALERDLAGVERELRKVVDTLIAEEPTRALRDRLRELEAKREDLERAIADVAAPAFELPPNVAEHYRRKVAELKKAFAWLNPEGRGALRKTFEALDPEGRAEAAAALRKLVTKVIIRPNGAYKPVDYDLQGDLARFLQLSDQPVLPTDYESVGLVVAGVGFEPTTFRL